MGLFDIFSKSSNKINVHFIDLATGQTIGTSEMPADQLPETFSIATTMSIQGSEWSVEEAVPLNSSEFIKTKKLVLKLRKIEYMNPKDILFTLPTISNELPAISDYSPFNDFETSIQEDDWRQNEFLLESSFPLLDIEIQKIKSIWENHHKDMGTFNAFDQCHARDSIGVPGLKLNFQKLKDILTTQKVGNLKMNGQFVKNGFSLKTTNTTYYGIIDGNTITELGINDFKDETIDEIHIIAKAFDLIFVNWYHCDIITEKLH